MRIRPITANIPENMSVRRIVSVFRFSRVVLKIIPAMLKINWITKKIKIAPEKAFEDALCSAGLLSCIPEDVGFIIMSITTTTAIIIQMTTDIQLITLMTKSGPLLLFFIIDS